MKKRLVRALRLSPSAWFHLATASFELLLARLRFSTKSVSTIIEELQRQSGRSGPRQHAGSIAVDLKKVSWATAVAAQYVPWRSDCLIQAMAADRWLRRHGIEPQFFLGAGFADDGHFIAHAWLRCGEIVVTGPGHEQYVPLIQPNSP